MKVVTEIDDDEIKEIVKNYSIYADYELQTEIDLIITDRLRSSLLESDEVQSCIRSNIDSLVAEVVETVNKTFSDGLSERVRDRIVRRITEAALDENRVIVMGQAI